MECLLPYLCMVTVPHIMVGLERMLDCGGVGLARFHCIIIQLIHTLVTLIGLKGNTYMCFEVYNSINIFKIIAKSLRGCT